VIGKGRILYLTIVLSGSLIIAGCDKFGSSSPETEAQRQEEQRLKDQKERAALVERMKAAAIAGRKETSIRTPSPPDAQPSRPTGT